MLAEKRKALLFAFSFATAVTTLGILLIRIGLSEYVGSIVLMPGTLVETACVKIGILSRVDDLPSRGAFLGPIWLFYFAVYYLIARWIARRNAANATPPQSLSS